IKKITYQDAEYPVLVFEFNIGDLALYGGGVLAETTITPGRKVLVIAIEKGRTELLPHEAGHYIGIEYFNDLSEYKANALAKQIAIDTKLQDHQKLDLERFTQALEEREMFAEVVAADNGAVSVKDLVADTGEVKGFDSFWYVLPKGPNKRVNVQTYNCLDDISSICLKNFFQETAKNNPLVWAFFAQDKWRIEFREDLPGISRYSSTFQSNEHRISLDATLLPQNGDLCATKRQILEAEIYLQVTRWWLENLKTGVTDDFKNSFLLLAQLRFIYRGNIEAVLRARSIGRLGGDFISLLRRYKHVRDNCDNPHLLPQQEMEVVERYLKQLGLAVNDSDVSSITKSAQLFAMLGEEFRKGEGVDLKKSYQYAIRYYSYAILLILNINTKRCNEWREVLLKVMREGVERSILPVEKENFIRLWDDFGKRRPNIKQLWEKVRSLIFIDELNDVPEISDGKERVSSRYGRISSFLEFLDLIDNVADGNTGIQDLEDYFRSKCFEGAKPPSSEEVEKFVQAYKAIILQEGMKKILWLSVMLLLYTRLLYRDESVDNWYFIPYLLNKLSENDRGIKSDEMQIIMGLTTLHRDFGTLFFGEGSPVYMEGHFSQIKKNLDKIKQDMDEEKKKAKAGPSVQGAPLATQAASTQADFVYSQANFEKLLEILDDKSVPLGDKANEAVMDELFPKMPELRKYNKWTEGSLVQKVREHCHRAVVFINAIDRGTEEALESINKEKAGDMILPETFSRCHRALEAMIGGDLKMRRLVYLAVFLHDIGEPSRDPHHAEIGAALIRKILQQMNDYLPDAEKFLSSHLNLAEWIVYHHVDFGTLHFAERTYAVLFTDKLGYQADSTALKNLALLNLADIYATGLGSGLSDDKTRFFIDTLSAPDAKAHLEKALGENFLDYRLRIFSTNREGLPESDSRRNKAKAELARIQQLYPEDYQCIRNYLGSVESPIQVIDYCFFFCTALRPEILIKLFFLLSRVARKAEEEIKQQKFNPLRWLKFSAPTALAPFS
ncbi:MAG: HD domain-containing protein, partial [Candidatus Omnitrophica bacterium]|nr:HD domain-containing protein [Candidatus Omnitrophota bacterium]